VVKNDDYEHFDWTYIWGIFSVEANIIMQRHLMFCNLPGALKCVTLNDLGMTFLLKPVLGIFDYVTHNIIKLHAGLRKMLNAIFAGLWYL